MPSNEYANLNRWTMPRDYFGAQWPDYYSAGVGKSRDSGALERANFQAMFKQLEPLDTGETPDGDVTVRVVRENHWAVGWVEWIAIHESNTAALSTADAIMGKLADYPVIDDELFSSIEDEDCRETWQNCYDAKERAQYLRAHVRSVYPDRCKSAYSRLRAAVKGDWYAAANLLPCPSDLIS